MAKLTEITFALMRIILAFLYTCHAIQKLFGLLGGHKVEGGILFVAAIIEIVCGPLIALGLFTRLAAFIASGEMAVAYFKMHAPGSFWPIVNHGEMAVALCFAFLFIFAHGGGRYSLDRVVRKKQ